MRRMKNYRNMSKERLLSALDESESAESRNNFDNARIKAIKEDFNKLRYRFFKSKIKEIEENLIWLEESLFKLKKYYDYVGTEYQGIRDIANLFNQSTNEDYYKQIWTKSSFNGIYIEYESKGDKNKNLSTKQYLIMIRPYLRDVIIDCKTQGEWKSQLTMSIIFFLL